MVCALMKIIAYLMVLLLYLYLLFLAAGWYLMVLCCNFTLLFLTTGWEYCFVETFPVVSHSWMRLLFWKCTRTWHCWTQWTKSCMTLSDREEFLSTWPTTERKAHTLALPQHLAPRTWSLASTGRQVSGIISVYSHFQLPSLTVCILWLPPPLSSWGSGANF